MFLWLDMPPVDHRGCIQRLPTMEAKCTQHLELEPDFYAKRAVHLEMGESLPPDHKVCSYCGFRYRKSLSVLLGKEVTS
jgi:hypothetical protein